MLQVHKRGGGYTGRDEKNVINMCEIFFKIEKRKSAWERGKEIVNKGKRGRNRIEGAIEKEVTN